MRTLYIYTYLYDYSLYFKLVFFFKVTYIYKHNLLWLEKTAKIRNTTVANFSLAPSKHEMWRNTIFSCRPSAPTLLLPPASSTGSVELANTMIDDGGGAGVSTPIPRINFYKRLINRRSESSTKVTARKKKKTRVRSTLNSTRISGIITDPLKFAFHGKKYVRCSLALAGGTIKTTFKKASIRRRERRPQGVVGN